MSEQIKTAASNDSAPPFRELLLYLPDDALEAMEKGLQKGKNDKSIRAALADIAKERAARRENGYE